MKTFKPVQVESWEEVPQPFLRAIWLTNASPEDLHSYDALSVLLTYFQVETCGRSQASMSEFFSRENITQLFKILGLKVVNDEGTNLLEFDPENGEHPDLDPSVCDDLELINI